MLQEFHFHLGRDTKVLSLPAPSSIVIIERRALIRECLAACLEERLEAPVLAYNSIQEWRDDPAGSCVRVLILSGAGLHASDEECALMRELSARHTPVVLFSDASRFHEDARRFGIEAEACRMPSDTPLDEVAETIRRVLREEASTHHDFAPAASHIDERPSQPGLGFTAREHDVVGALMTGKSNKVIAGELKISENSVKVHLRNVMRKLDVHNRTEAVIKIAKATRPHNFA